MTGIRRAAGRHARTTAAALPLLLAAAGLLAAGCGAQQDAGEEGPPDTLAAAADDTAAAASADTVAADTAGAEDAPADTGAGAGVDTAAGSGGAVVDTADRRWPPGGYVVYLRRDEIPDSVAADHGVEPDTVLAELPGFYARLTADQAGGLARDERVRELARQLEERPTPGPRGMPSGGGDTTGGG